MAFFKFRARGQRGEEQSPNPAESIDDMRRRARHRLIGATVLVLMGVLGFPLLFDTQPRPIQVDIPIEIPDRDKTRPLGAGGKIGAAESTPPAAPARVQADASLSAKEEVVADKAPSQAAAKDDKPAAQDKAERKTVRAESRPEPKAEPKVERKAEPKPEPKAQAKASAAADESAKAEAAKARALLEGKAANGDGQERFILQVGAFADAEKARETRTRLERAGLKTYTQVVETKEGKRIRVRVGPYTQRADADKAAAQIKSLSLPVSVLAL